MTIRTHKTATILAIVAGTLAGGYVAVFTTVILCIYYPLKIAAIPLAFYYLVPFAIGGYFGAHLLPFLFGALIRAKCLHCGARARRNASAFGMGLPSLIYTCVDCERIS